jgi:hypothetical protein
MKKGGEALEERDLFKSYSDEELVEGWVLYCEPPAFDLRWYGFSRTVRKETVHLFKKT